MWIVSKKSPNLVECLWGKKPVDWLIRIIDRLTDVNKNTPNPLEDWGRKLTSFVRDLNIELKIK